MSDNVGSPEQAQSIRPKPICVDIGGFVNNQVFSPKTGAVTFDFSNNSYGDGDPAMYTVYFVVKL